MQPQLNKATERLPHVFRRNSTIRMRYYRLWVMTFWVKEVAQNMYNLSLTFPVASSVKITIVSRSLYVLFFGKCISTKCKQPTYSIWRKLMLRYVVSHDNSHDSYTYPLLYQISMFTLQYIALRIFGHTYGKVYLVGDCTTSSWYKTHITGRINKTAWAT